MKQNRIFSTATTVAVLLIMLACKSNSQQSADGQEVKQLGNDTIEIAEGSSLISKLKHEQVSTSPYSETIQTTGVITPIPTQYAEIAVPLAGRVVKDYIHLGQTVNVGTPLFDIASSDYSEIAKDYSNSLSEMKQAERAFNRAKDLYYNRVASSKEMEEAQTAYNIAREEYNHSLAVAKEYQLNVNNLIVGQPMTVHSPVRGKVLKDDLVIGEYLHEDADAKVIVADLDKVWLKANISEKVVPMVSNIQQVDIRTVANNDSVIHGKIIYLGGMLDPETRTLQTVIECDNRNGILIPNMYADLILYQSVRDYIIIPKEAVLQRENGRYVLRKVGERLYYRTLVNVHSTADGRLIVTDGLHVGDEIITQGAFYLTK